MFFQISDYLWARSVEIEPRNSDTIKRRNCERRWPGLNLKSPGIRPKDLRGKNHPKPLVMGSRSREDVSPLVSPSFGSPGAVFKQSPASTPVTPSPRETGGAGEQSREPEKIVVNLPQAPFSSGPTFPTGKPPPLPPKPTPPLPPRDTSPPPPIPPRMMPVRPHSTSHRSPLESRPPLMDPVFPQQSLPPSILPRHRPLNGSSLDPPVSPALPGRHWTQEHPGSSLSSLSTSPLSRPPTSLPHSASWLPNNNLSQSHNGLGPLSAGPEIGSHFTFGAHTNGPGNTSVGSFSTGSTVSPQLPPRPTRTTSTPR